MVASGNVGIAFGMVFAAGAASAVGAACVFCVGLASPLVVASSLGFAAGVMLYVVFTEIFMKNCNGSFELAGYSENAAYRLATACLFCGIFATALLDVCVHQMMHWAAKVKQRRVASSAAVSCTCSQSAGTLTDLSCTSPPAAAADAAGKQQQLQRQQAQEQQQMQKKQQPPAGALAIEMPALMADSAYGEVHLHHPLLNSPSCCLQSVSEEDCETGSALGCCSPGECGSIPTPGSHGCQDGGGPTARCCNVGAGEAAFEIAPGTASAEVVSVLQEDPNTKDLLRMGVFTGLAIAVHNLPEGLATFVGALNDTKVGASIAVAIAIHNVPEGICVAMPIYYATGSKWKGFMWGSLTGLAEPVGGLLGYLAVHKQSDLSFAIVFGIVAGMMVYVSIKELLPSAFRFDPKDQVVSTSVIVGMGVMAASLLLFTL